MKGKKDWNAQCLQSQMSRRVKRKSNKVSNSVGVAENTHKEKGMYRTTRARSSSRVRNHLP